MNIKCCNLIEGKILDESYIPTNNDNVLTDAIF